MSTTRQYQAMISASKKRSTPRFWQSPTIVEMQMPGSSMGHGGAMPPTATAAAAGGSGDEEDIPANRKGPRISSKTKNEPKPQRSDWKVLDEIEKLTRAVNQEFATIQPAEMANRILDVVRKYTDWNNAKQLSHAKNTFMAILPMFGIRAPVAQVIKDPNFQVTDDAVYNPEQVKFKLAQIANGKVLNRYNMGAQKHEPNMGYFRKDSSPNFEGVEPTLQAMELLAYADRNVFKHLIECVGLHIIGKKDNDPLRKQAMNEEIEALAGEITESAMEFAEIDPYLLSLKELAEALGYIVSVAA